LTLPYTIEIQRDDSGDYRGWFARVRELPGCMTQAEHFEELGTMVEDAMRAWIEVALEDGQPVPEPAPEEQYSGKFVLRVPRSLHRQLAEAAEAEGVSLNQYCSTALALVLGQAQRTGLDVKGKHSLRSHQQTSYSTQRSGAQIIGEEKPTFDVSE
jgi:antitoxin HicB